MDNDLQSIYENNYLSPNKLVMESKGKKESDESDETVGGEYYAESAKKKPTSFKKKFLKRKKREKSGEEYAESFMKGESPFEKILREMQEFGFDGGDMGGEDEGVYDADGGDDSFGDEGGDEQTFTLSELRNMTLGEIVDMLAGGGEDDSFGDEGDFDFEGDVGEGDEIPLESYGFSGGEGNYKGDQGNYDGRARRQPETTRVKGNGDADFGKQDTGYDPDDTEGSEGAEHGAQGNYDGRARRQPETNHVKGNGDADFGKSKTGYKTKSGKKEKNYF